MSKIMDYLEPKVKEMFLATGTFPPFLHVVDDESKVTIIDVMPFMTSDHGKDSLGNKCRLIAKHSKVKSLILITEAWMLNVPHEKGKKVDLDALPRPSKHPDRIECVIINAQHKDEPDEIFAYEIKRDANDKAIDLVLRSDLSKAVGFEGRLCNFFNKPQPNKEKL